MERFYKLKLFFASLLSAMILLGSAAYAGENNKDACQCKIKTNAFSWMCKNKIEKKLKDTPGVSDCYVSMTDRMATVKFDKEKITMEQLVKKIQDMGYVAELASADTTSSNSNQRAPNDKR